ncbi:uncharacterized protein DUF262 [Winogradskyella wandonensis]|uniref:Uncharacterized protein DUF262 n=1 Tax=Winogradskyella wandonensis TaxID=1442586 RepID=A0A4R1KYH0_9FLAO|nr:DUF262 domain-containing protein [Winogradskyella wandonensis]TCK69209.1 uncharacterized protein DUF262 [Winogradskyella wandonensis]
MKLIEQIDIQPQTAKWLYDLSQKGLLEVDNSFQRNYVWTEKNQIQLIESILIGYPIPEIYLWNTGTDGDTGDTKYSIIDGQQRCGAVFQYIANNFKLKASSLDANNPIKGRIQDRLFKDLEADDKKSIWSYLFSIRLVRNQVERVSIVNMFLRLNSNNMTLNPQELRNAEFEGEFMLLSSKLAELDFWEDNNIFGVADRRRMRDISFVSTLLVFLKKGIEEDIGNTNLNQIYDLYNDDYPDKDKDENKFKEILSEINKVIENNKERIKILKRQVHFYTLFTVIFDILNNQKTLTENQISNYRNFIDNYDNDALLEKYYADQLSSIYSYKSLVKEGTRQKSNRFERHRHLKRIINK